MHLVSCSSQIVGSCFDHYGKRAQFSSLLESFLRDRSCGNWSNITYWNTFEASISALLFRYSASTPGPLGAKISLFVEINSLCKIGLRAKKECKTFPTCPTFIFEETLVMRWQNARFFMGETAKSPNPQSNFVASCYPNGIT